MRILFLLLVSVSCVCARPVEVRNFAAGNLCLSVGDGYFWLPAGSSRLVLPDGPAILSTTQGVVNITISGGEWEGCLVTVSGALGVPVASVESYKEPWWYFLLGTGFMAPIVGFGFLLRSTRKMSSPMSEV
jgi:hypothetical protein